jgi:hypothetical protein
MMKLPKYLCVAASALLIGCASGDAELKDSVMVNTKPNGAMVQVDNVRVGRAPIRVQLERSRNHEITVSASGQATRKVIVRPALKNNDYGFSDAITVELTPAEGAVPAEDIKEFDELKSTAMLPFGANPETYGTLEADLAEAKLVAQKLDALAAAARQSVERAEDALAKAIEDAKTKPSENESKAAIDLNKSEDSLRANLASAVTAEEKARQSQKAVAERIALLESMQEKREVPSKQSIEELDTARKSLEESNAKIAEIQQIIQGANATLAAAVVAREEITKNTGGVSEADLQALTEKAEKQRNSAKETAEKLELSSKAVSSRVDDLARQVLESKANPDQEVAQKLAAAQARITTLENNLAQEKLTSESNQRAQPVVAPAPAPAPVPEGNLSAALTAAQAESRARTYSEYTARKGLLERQVRNGEITRDQYRALLAQLDKELRRI